MQTGHGRSASSSADLRHVRRVAEGGSRRALGGAVGSLNMYVFAYGSLLSARSAVRTLPGMQVEHCVPARIADHIRTFDVAFPNDASQPDKSYFHHDGTRPEAVLFANLRRHAGAPPVNGVLVPVGSADVRRLVHRERRYRLVEVGARVRPYSPWSLRQARVFTFIGRSRFTGQPSAARGVVPSGYLGSIMEGVGDWDRRCPGFRADFAASTRTPPSEKVVPLRRVDLPG